MPTTISRTVGATGFYSTLAAWEAARPTSFAAADEIWIARLQKQVFDELVVVGGCTQTPTQYSEITADTGASYADTPSNAARYNSANGATIQRTGGYEVVLDVTENFTRVNRLQIAATATNSAAYRQVGANSDCNNCIIEGGHCPSVQPGAVYIQNGKIRNSLVKATHASWPAIILADAGSSYNCLTYSLNSNTGRGIQGDYGTGTIQNCGQFGFALASKTANSSAMTITTSYTNVASPTGGWTGGIAFSTATFANITNGSENLKLVSGSALLDVGTTDSTNAATDMFGNSRPQGSAYDIGPIEFSAAVGGRIMGAIAGAGGLAGIGGLAGTRGGLAG